MNRSRGKIRPPRRGLATDHVDFDEYWEVLAQSLREIYAKNASHLSFEELYRNAYKLVLKKHGDRLYGNVKKLVGEHLQVVAIRDVKPLLPSSIVTGDVSFGTATTERRTVGTKFLERLKFVWEDHQLCMGMMKEVLMYMDRVFCADHKIPSIYVACMGLFRDHILRHQEYNIGNALNNVILDQIKMERDGDIINRATIRACVYMLEGLYETEEELESQKVYLTSFEKNFILASENFYQKEGEQLLRDCDAATYIQKVDKRLKEEYSRCHDTLSVLTEPKIMKVVDQKLIEANINDVMDMEGSGLRFMLDNDRYEDLKLVYELISRVDSEKKSLKKKMCARLVAIGKEINRSVSTPQISTAAGADGTGDASKPSSTVVSEEKAANNVTLLAIRWVDEVLALKDKYETLWERSFDKDKGIQAAMTKAFTDFINDFERSPEFISLFIDENLRKGLKGKTESEVDAVLDKALTLFRYVADKDVFERYYKKHLSRRLLMNRSVSHDAEKQMIGKFKMEVGFAFTGKFEGMFKDMNTSEDMTSEYKKLLQESDSDYKKGVELSVQILTSTFWPVGGGGENDHPCIYPPEIGAVRDSFTKYYLDRHSGRRLDWRPDMGTADVRATFKGKRHELNVTTYGMVILMAFSELNPGETLSFEGIRAITSIKEQDLIRNLQALAVAPKTRVLIKKPMSRDVRLTDVFAVNEEFTSKFMRIRVGVVATNRAETEQERKDSDEKTERYRGATIEAAIVRIMKQRKLISHTELVNEVLAQMGQRFSPELSMIKKRIESLMEREYMERAEGERQAYRYIA
ncbi:Cullin-domain-containing protein [Choiromyces venosus 120613-1]|uniref:Cullin-domain-containing protein n=1 Tax=Choiromyces venosus 120613-1 TaxID=1336337 RepID=A0A3N4JF45_9PEZI|nr:Cullin-domain-containing protein [Choiromyces venosus 120613-1]